MYIRKETEYFGELAPHGNTYHYLTDDPAPDWPVIAEQIAGDEASVLPSDVINFSYSVWGPTDGPDLENVIQASGELQLQGTSADAPAMYKESCVLCVWELPRSVPLNRRRWLRKFLRQANPGAAMTPAQLAGAEAIPAAVKADLIQFWADPVTSFVHQTFQYQLCTEDGDLPITGPLIRDFVYTRQIGR